VSYKVENIIAVWNINTCQKIFQFNAIDRNFGNINQAYFYCLSPDYVLISGDKALMIHVPSGEEIIIAEDIQTKIKKGELSSASLA